PRAAAWRVSSTTSITCTASCCNRVFAMTVRRSLWVVCLVAVLHSLFFIWYQRPDWATEWSDQDGYRRLGQVLADTGRFTRYPDAARFVPEVIRTPVYPAFVAVVYRLFGAHQIAVALAQTL